MYKRIKLLLPFLIFGFFVTVSAHPLGNFSINQYSRIDIEKSQINLRSVLDIAEIPTFQLISSIDINQDKILSSEELNAYVERLTPDYVANIHLSLNEEPIALNQLSKEITIVNGAGNLPTLRIVWNFTGDVFDSAPINRVRFENQNNKERIGWNEIVVQHTNGIKVFDSTVFGSGITDELKSYPQQSIDAPLTERSAEFSFTSGNIPPNAIQLQKRDGYLATPVEKDKFAELINVPEITFSILIAGILLAFGFGAMHALSPGHGKTVVGAYLVGSKGTVKHAVFLGLTVTVTHTISVFVLGIIALFASNYILPESVMPLLSFGSGLMVFFIGITLFKERLLAALSWSTVESGTYKHNSTQHFIDHEHKLETETDITPVDNELTHTHGGSTHSHELPADVSWNSLLGLGISGGLLPCPSALVLMLSAISINRIYYGLLLTLIFSLGLAVTLTVVGLIFLHVGKLFGKSSSGDSRIIKMLPAFSAFIITCIGALICYKSVF